MPVWPGGPCPECGEEMPPRVVHCRICRRLLNEDLEEDTVVEPVFVPLREIASVAVVAPGGVYEGCPACARELRINRRYAGKVVRCNYCRASFTMSPGIGPQPGRKAYYVDCPHCRQELRIATKYLGQRVACKFCGGEFQLNSAEGLPSTAN